MKCKIKFVKLQGKQAVVLPHTAKSSVFNDWNDCLNFNLRDKLYQDHNGKTEISRNQKFATSIHNNRSDQNPTWSEATYRLHEPISWKPCYGFITTNY